MALTEIEALRLRHGDTNCDCPLLSDQEYQYFIDTYPNASRRDKLIDLAILQGLAMFTHERSGQEEVWANQMFEQRKAMLDYQYKDPTFTGGANSPIIIGGVSKTEMATLASNPDRVPDTFYKGGYRRKAEWQTSRIYHYIGRNREPYECKWYPYII